MLIYCITIQLVTDTNTITPNPCLNPLLSEGWNRKCLTPMSSLTDMCLVYKIPLCVWRRVSAGQAYPCLCLVIPSRKYDSRGCFCSHPAVMVSSTDADALQEPRVARFFRACPRGGVPWLFQPPWCSHLCRWSDNTPHITPCSLQRSQRQALSCTPPSQDGLGSRLSFSISFSINGLDI